MSNNYTPAVTKTISVAHGIAEAGELVEFLIDTLWGDTDAIKKAADTWGVAAEDAGNYIVQTILNEVKTTGRDHWSGDAQNEYTTWMKDLHTQLDRLEKGIRQVHAKLMGVRDAVEHMHDDLEKTGQWFLGEIAAAAIKGKSPQAAGLLMLAATWQLVQKLQDYHYNASEKFRTAVTELQILRSQSETLMTRTPMSLPGPLPLPVDATNFGPAFPTRQVGDWRNWGDATPRTRQ